MTSNEIRKVFLDFFVSKDHRIIKSSSLVPSDDPTLLIVNSGMAPLKKYFTGEESPPYPRLCNIQKCVRINDIEDVGNRYHLTFFEMMGNWSIGDYFKEKAINLAWELLIDTFGFNASKIYVTVYGGDKKLPGVPSDKETVKIWKEVGLPLERIILLGAKVNFWGPTSNTGPCGPCTEVFIDRGEKYGCGEKECGPGCKSNRFLEIWNAGVFMQYYLHKDKSLTGLPLKNVDAGAGLDRFAVVTQNVDSVYETDLLNPIIKIFTSNSNLDIESKSLRIITDHIRCATFMIADNIFPGNTKREYVVRRILRRALLHANIVGLDRELFLKAIDTVVKLFSRYYPELESNCNVVKSVVEKESMAFNRTLNRSLRQFNKILTYSQETISGKDAFKLSDTYGLPFELTKELAKEKGLKVNEEGYKLYLEEQRKRSREKQMFKKGDF